MPQKSLQRRYGVVAGAAVVAIMVSFLFAANTTISRRDENDRTNRSQAHTDAVICQRVNHIYTSIQKSIRVSIEATPKIAYYRTHKEDLAKVQAQQRDNLKTFAPQKCPPDPDQPVKKETK